MPGRVRTFTIGSDTYDIPEEEAYAAYRELSGGHELPEEASDPMHVGTPEVIKGPTSAESFDSEQAPLGRTLSMSEVRGTTPEAPAGTDWMRGLMSGGDPTGAASALSTVGPEEWGDIPGQLNSTAAGAVHGTAAGLERRVPGVREWSIEAERAHPMPFAAGDVGATLLPINPLNKVAQVTRLIPAATKLSTLGRVAGDVAMQTGLGAVDTAARRYGDDLDLSVSDALGQTTKGEIGLDVALSAPGAVLGGVGARSHYRQTRPEAMQLRHEEYVAQRLKSAGLDPVNISQLGPEKAAEILAEVEMLAAQGGERWRDAPSVQQMNLRARKAADSARNDKEGAIGALAALGAEVDPDLVAQGIRNHPTHGVKPGTAPRISDHNQAVDASAQRYNDMERRVSAQPSDTMELDAVPEAAPPPLPPPPLPAGPPPLPAAAPPTQRAAPPPLPEFDADGTRILPDSAVTAVPPSARYQPPPPAPPPRPSARAPRHINPPIGEGYVPPQDLPPDPVGALAAQAPPDDMAALMEDDMIASMLERGEIDPAELMERGHTAGMERNMGGPPPPRPSARYQEPQVPELAPQHVTPVRPSARYQPQPEAMPAGPSGAPGAQATTPPVAPPPPDPVGALAAQAQPPAAPPEQFVRGVPSPNQPMQTQVHGMGVQEFLDEKNFVGEAIDERNFDAQNNRLRAQYGSLMNAAREGFPQAQPQIPYAHPAELTQQWDQANTQEGLLNTIAQEGARAASGSTPRMLGGAASVLGGGGTAAHLAGALNLPMGLALGAGAAAAGWALPRRHALQAKWLSSETGAMMDRLSRFGQKPVGSLTASFGDMMREPPPPEAAAEQSGVPDGSTSALSPGEFLGRETTDAMLANPDAFQPYADDYSQAGTDDRRAAVTERLYRTDPQFARNVFPTIRGEIA